MLCRFLRISTAPGCRTEDDHHPFVFHVLSCFIESGFYRTARTPFFSAATAGIWRICDAEIEFTETRKDAQCFALVDCGMFVTHRPVLVRSRMNASRSVVRILNLPFRVPVETLAVLRNPARI